jgi:hypothetical protein
MPLYSFDPLEAETLDRRRRTGSPLEELWGRRRLRRVVTRRRVGAETPVTRRTTAGRRAA